MEKQGWGEWMVRGGKGCGAGMGWSEWMVRGGKGCGAGMGWSCKLRYDRSTLSYLPIQ